MAAALAHMGVICSTSESLPSARYAMPPTPFPTQRPFLCRPAASRPATARLIAAVADPKVPAAAATPHVHVGQIRNVSAKDAGTLVADGWVLLDTRPPTEIEKARLKNAVEVPLFVVDDDPSISTLIKKATAIGMGGWWLGGSHMKPNLNFLRQVQEKVAIDAPGVVVVCQKGLRSLTASETLARAGYPTIAWINGGLDTARPGELETVDETDIRYGGIGGLSEFLGWTEVQREAGGGFAGGSQNLLKIAAGLLVIDMAYLAYIVATYDGP